MSTSLFTQILSSDTWPAADDVEPHALVEVVGRSVALRAQKP